MIFRSHKMLNRGSSVATPSFNQRISFFIAISFIFLSGYWMASNSSKVLFGLYIWFCETSTLRILHIPSDFSLRTATCTHVYTFMALAGQFASLVYYHSIVQSQGRHWCTGISCHKVERPSAAIKPLEMAYISSRLNLKISLRFVLSPVGRI